MAAVAFDIGMAFIYVCKKKKNRNKSGDKSFTLTVLLLQMLLLLGTVIATVCTGAAFNITSNIRLSLPSPKQFSFRLATTALQPIEARPS